MKRFVYTQALRLSKTALGETTVGQVVNLLSNDVNRFDIAVIFLHYLWIGPLETIVVTYFLWQEVGVSSIFGVAALLMFIPLQGMYRKKKPLFGLYFFNQVRWFANHVIISIPTKVCVVMTIYLYLFTH